MEENNFFDDMCFLFWVIMFLWDFPIDKCEDMRYTNTTADEQHNKKRRNNNETYT